MGYVERSLRANWALPSAFVTMAVMLLRRLIVFLLPWITALHRWLLRVTGGRMGSAIFGFRFLTLENRGRRSGALHTTPLLYVPDGESFLIAASNAGQDRDPVWWLNLHESPETAIHIGRARIPVRAERLAGADEEAMWAKMQDSMGLFEAYRAGTTREIPLIRLTRR